MLSIGVHAAEESIAESYHRLLLNEGLLSTESQKFCHELNNSQCAFTERIEIGSDIVVTMYNPLIHPVQHYMRLPVRNFGYRVKDASGGSVPVQVMYGNSSAHSILN